MRDKDTRNTAGRKGPEKEGPRKRRGPDKGGARKKGGVRKGRDPEKRREEGLCMKLRERLQMLVDSSGDRLKY